MATTTWWGNGAAISAVTKATVTGVAIGGVLTATLNTKVISYVCVTGDTVTTATAAWLALLSSSNAPPEFQEQTWTASGTDGILATAKTPGTPFFGMTNGLVFSATLGAGVTQTTVTANSSPADAADPKNWLRNSANSLPQYGDALVIADTAVPILWNLDALADIQLANYTRYQSFTGQIGLPPNNPNGYKEYRPQYLKLKGGAPAGASSSSPGTPGTPVFNVLLGFGGGSGPSREKYDFQATQTRCIVQASGQPQASDFAVRLLGANGSNVLTIVGTSVAVAMLPGEVAALASAEVTQGGSLSLGPGAAVSGDLDATGSGLAVNCPVAGTITCQDSSQLIQGVVASDLVLTYPVVLLRRNSSAQWVSGSGVTALTLQTASVFNKAQSLQNMIVTALVLDADSCTFNAPQGSVTFTTPVVLRNALQSGPLILPANTTFQVTLP